MITKYLNPYYYIGAAIVLASLGGTFYFQNKQIHHYHQLFDKEHDNFVKERTVVLEMQLRQIDQSLVTEKNVTKVVTVPETTKTIVKEVKEVPVPTDCSAPVYPPEVYNAF